MTARRLKLFVPIVLVLGLLAVLGYGLTRQPDKLPAKLVGQPAPSFRLPTLADNQQTVSNEALKGQVTLVNVWASWCAACRAEHDVITDLSQRTGVPVVGINYKDKRADAKKWLARFGNPFARIAFDPNGRVGVDWGVAGVPETFLLDSDGVIRYKLAGVLTRDTMRQDVLPRIRALKQAS
ncbi:DsbE family thiol:disulfide interchange protein [Salinisphaera orenii]|uniref:DsbE family thiol:disulfide interchange protein n=1 Tax=Salinisphaera orenii TaxID=856731 RepID=UPI0019550AF4